MERTVKMFAQNSVKVVKRCEFICRLRRPTNTSSHSVINNIIARLSSSSSQYFI